jgi:transposase-like protein
MPKKRFSPEQIVTLLRQIEVTMDQGKSAQIACREAGISEQSYYRWRKEYGGLDLDQARRMKDRRRSVLAAKTPLGRSIPYQKSQSHIAQNSASNDHDNPYSGFMGMAVDIVQIQGCFNKGEKGQRPE